MITVMVWFGIGVLVGIGLTGFAAWIGLRAEWKNQNRIERDVQSLMRHFACGQGFIGCNGGPKCRWEHK
jgi:hypothetical protein